VLLKALLPVLSGAVRLTVRICGRELSALGSVLLALRDVETGTVGFAIGSVVREPYTLIEYVVNGIAISELIFAV
jgi:hypothetical protein